MGAVKNYLGEHEELIARVHQLRDDGHLGVGEFTDAEEQLIEETYAMLDNMEAIPSNRYAVLELLAKQAGIPTPSEAVEAQLGGSHHRDD